MIESFIARTQKFKEKGRIDVCVRCLASERGKKKDERRGCEAGESAGVRDAIGVRAWSIHECCLL